MIQQTDSGTGSTDRAKQRINFTKAALERLQATEARQVVHDEAQPGLCIFVEPSGGRTFYVYKKISGRPRRIRVGSFPVLTVEQARRDARRIIADIERGIDPVETRRKARAEMTIGDLWQTFQDQHATPHKKASSNAGDLRIWNAHLKAMKARPLSSVKRGDVQRLHTRIGTDAPYMGNRVLALLSKMFTVAMDLESAAENPCRGIKKFHEDQRERFMDGGEIKRFITTATAEPDPDDVQYIEQKMLDFFAMLLWTGARRGNVQAMRWDGLDLKAKNWRVAGELMKNGEPLCIHLSEPAIEILKRRQGEAKLLRKAGKASEFVFPGRTAGSHLVEPKKSWAVFCKKAKLKNLRMHDLRRTLGSWQAMTGASLPIIGKSLGHKTQQATAIYARMNLDPVRAAVDMATVAMLAAASAKDDGEVLAKIG